MQSDVGYVSVVTWPLDEVVLAPSGQASQYKGCRAAEREEKDKKDCAWPLSLACFGPRKNPTACLPGEQQVECLVISSESGAAHTEVRQQHSNAPSPVLQDPEIQLRESLFHLFAKIPLLK